MGQHTGVVSNEREREDTSQSVESARLTFGSESCELPIVRGSEGEVAVDISSLRKTTGLITLDPGFANTGACRSAITFIDGEKGILRYRGYPIEELAERHSFLEVAHLLLFGSLAEDEALGAFRDEIVHHTMPHEDFKRFFGALPKSAHPMPSLAAAVGALATFYTQPETDEQIHVAVMRLLAKLPTLAAWSYKHSVGQPFMYPRNNLGYAENFLQMMFATPCEEYQVDPEQARALDRLLVLHADHEQNCSTSTVRMVASSGAHLYAAIAAGISALWGPLHGGANQAVIDMLERIAREDGSAQRFVNRAKNGEARLMGFGHRVYKSYDPRAAVLKDTCADMIRKAGSHGYLFEIAQDLEAIALDDEYFVERNLYPNVDFYSGVIYKAIGIPEDMFTVLFALGRLPGWVAHVLEMRHDPDLRIGRPRQIYTGSTEIDSAPGQ